MLTRSVVRSAVRRASLAQAPARRYAGAAGWQHPDNEPYKEVVARQKPFGSGVRLVAMCWLELERPYRFCFCFCFVHACVRFLLFC